MFYFRYAKKIKEACIEFRRIHISDDKEDDTPTTSCSDSSNVPTSSNINNITNIKQQTGTSTVSLNKEDIVHDTTGNIQHLEDTNVNFISSSSKTASKASTSDEYKDFDFLGTIPDEYCDMLFERDTPPPHILNRESVVTDNNTVDNITADKTQDVSKVTNTLPEKGSNVVDNIPLLTDNITLLTDNIALDTTNSDKTQKVPTVRRNPNLN